MFFALIIKTQYLIITPTGKKNETKQRNQSLYIFYIEKYIKITYYTIHQLIMDNENLINKINLLEEELKKTKEQLQKYTNGNNHKTYYEKNKEIVMQKASENKKKIKETNPEKIKEYAKRAYLKRKEKLKELKLENENISEII